MMISFETVVGVKVDANNLEILPYQDFLLRKPPRDTRFLLADLDEVGRMLMLEYYIPQLRKFNRDDGRESKFILEKSTFNRFEPKLYQIDYQVSPDGEFETVAIHLN